jgi:hypothetical protein
MGTSAHSIDHEQEIGDTVDSKHSLSPLEITLFVECLRGAFEEIEVRLLDRLCPGVTQEQADKLVRIMWLYGRLSPESRLQKAHALNGRIEQAGISLRFIKAEIERAGSSHGFTTSSLQRLWFATLVLRSFQAGIIEP